MTVGQLLDRLRDFPRELKLVALWDCTPNFDVHRAEPFTTLDGQAVVVLDCGAGDGDWEWIVKEYGGVSDGH